MSRLRRGQAAEPETRIGICCGDACKAEQQTSGTWNRALLFKVPGIYRYRCAGCFAQETGRRHHLATTTADELAGMAWWNGLSETARTAALISAGWSPDGSYTPSAADAWAWHKRERDELAADAAEIDGFVAGMEAAERKLGALRP